MAGTSATAVLSEVSLTVSPLAGAGPDRTNERAPTALALSVRFWGVKLNVAATCTGVGLPTANPGAKALIFAVPRLRPFTVGWIAGAVALNAMKTLEGVMDTLDGWSLARLIVTPPSGAGVARVIGNGAVWPKPTVSCGGNTINPTRTMFTAVVPPVKPGAPAVIVAAPRVKPVTVNDPVVAPPGMLTMGGSTSTTPVGLAAKVTARPPAGAGALKMMLPFAVRVGPKDVESVASVIVAAITLTIVKAPKKLGAFA
jgi:hypothetical protein